MSGSRVASSDRSNCRPLAVPVGGLILTPHAARRPSITITRSPPLLQRPTRSLRAAGQYNASHVLPQHDGGAVAAWVYAGMGVEVQLTDLDRCLSSCDRCTSIYIREDQLMHVVVEPKILYFGTPVVLISSLNADGSANLAPMSSAWWLGQSAMLGMSARSQTVANLRRDPHCVLNLPSADLVGAVDRLALLTGRHPVPEYHKRSQVP